MTHILLLYKRKLQLLTLWLIVKITGRLIDNEKIIFCCSPILAVAVFWFLIKETSSVCISLSGKIHQVNPSISKHILLHHSLKSGAQMRLYCWLPSLFHLIISWVRRKSVKRKQPERNCDNSRLCKTAWNYRRKRKDEKKGTIWRTSVTSFHLRVTVFLTCSPSHFVTLS